MARIEEPILVSITTEENLIIPIDYDDAGSGSVGDPPDGTVFRTQSDVNDLLTENGWTAFKHLQAAYDALPNTLANLVIFSCSAGNHRPLPSQVSDRYGIKFEKKLLLNNGFVVVQGSPNYTQISASVDVIAVNSGEDPYADVAGTPYPADDSLRGYYAIFDNGQILPIVKHTTNRLYLLESLSPTPTSVFIGKPSTVFTNTINDIDKTTPYGNLIATLNSVPGSDSSVAYLTYNQFNDIEFYPFKGGSAVVLNYSENNSRVQFNRCLFDWARVYVESGVACGYPVSGNGLIYINRCSHRGEVIGGRPSAYSDSFRSEYILFVFYSYIGGCAGGPTQYNNYASMSVASNWIDVAAYGIRIEYRGRVTISGNTTTRPLTIINSQRGFNIKGNTLIELNSAKIEFDNITLRCFEFGDNCMLIAEEGTPVIRNKPDGVGIPGYGFYFANDTVCASMNIRGNSVTLSASSGDIRMADGAIYSLAELAAETGFEDPKGNKIIKSV